MDLSKKLYHTLMVSFVVLGHSVCTNAAYSKQPPVHQLKEGAVSQLRPSAIRINDYIDLKISGQLNQAVMHFNDGVRSRTFFGNNNISDSRIKFNTVAKTSSYFNLFTTAEIGIRNDSSNVISQVNPSPSDTLVIRIAEAGIESPAYGKLSLGHGKTASDGTAEIDLSGTEMIGASAIQKMGGSMIFSTKGTDVLADNPSIGNVLDNLDGLSRLGRLRYDSPKFAGFQVSGSVIERSDSDIALRYNQELSSAKIAAAIALENNSTIQSTVPGRAVDGSVSVLFNNGMNVTIAGGKVHADLPNRNDPFYHYVKLGYQMNLVSAGKTNASIDWGKFSNYALNNDKASSYGLAVVQNFKQWNADYFLGFRTFYLDRSTKRFNRMKLAATGLTIKF